ncbi:MAG TPA: zf-TFIIB domain-containing protein [Tepidisphaeraceae bacterium]|jgi:hypothetical protein
MKCPVCPQSTLTISERQGIEIDYCPTCRGVWLDRGELDKIIERADTYREPARTAEMPPPVQQRPMKPDDSHYGYQHHPNQTHHKKRGFWHELFD